MRTMPRGLAVILCFFAFLGVSACTRQPAHFGMDFFRGTQNLSPVSITELLQPGKTDCATVQRVLGDPLFEDRRGADGTILAYEYNQWAFQRKMAQQSFGGGSASMSGSGTKNHIEAKCAMQKTDDNFTQLYLQFDGKGTLVDYYMLTTFPM